jgi:cobalt-precorrin-5B (C1)-methyltransferase
MVASTQDSVNEKGTALKRGWTTGACATAATSAALYGLFSDAFKDPIQITLPGGQTPDFALAAEERGDDFAMCGIVKDAGDDPDVTHGAMVRATVRQLPEGSGIQFKAGKGVGMVTKPGLPIPPGEPAINPVPRKMMIEHCEKICAELGARADIEITISVDNGEALAQQTWNPRLGIVGGLSILGTTGIVVPFSCAAWIHSIHRGIDVARAEGLTHVVGSTGDASEKAAQKRLGLPLEAYLDMGDFAGGLLKYLKANPVPNLTICGGFAKITKLAEGHLDLHSGRSQVGFDWLAEQAQRLGADEALCSDIRVANTAKQVLELCTEAQIPIAEKIAELAAQVAQGKLRNNDIHVSVLVTDRKGVIIAES